MWTSNPLDDMPAYTPAPPPRSVKLRKALIRRYDRPEDVTLYETDLYHGCRTETRYLGVILVPLLEHLALCVLIARHGHASAKIKATCAAHDLSEVYLRDLPTGLKDLLPDYKALESRWQTRIYNALGLYDGLDESEWCQLTRVVKEIDTAALIVESTVHVHPGLGIMIEETGQEVDFYLCRQYQKHIFGRPSRSLWIDYIKNVLQPRGGGIEWDME